MRGPGAGRPGGTPSPRRHAMPAGFVHVGEVRFVLGVEDAKLVVTTQHEVWGQVAERPEAWVGPLNRKDSLALVTKVKLSSGTTSEPMNMGGDVELPQAV